MQRNVRVLKARDVVVSVRSDVACVGRGNKNNEHNKHWRLHGWRWRTVTLTSESWRSAFIGCHLEPAGASPVGRASRQTAQSLGLVSRPRAPRARSHCVGLTTQWSMSSGDGPSRSVIAWWCGIDGCQLLTHATLLRHSGRQVQKRDNMSAARATVIVHTSTYNVLVCFVNLSCVCVYLYN